MERLKKLIWLAAQDVKAELAGKYVYQHQHIAAGRFEVKTGTTSETNYAFSQARFTPKGIEWIGGMWTAHIAKGHAA